MINIPYLYIAGVLIAIWTIYRIIVVKKNRDKERLREVFINIFFIYFLILIEVTICKTASLQIHLNANKYINYIPFVETLRMFKGDGMRLALYNVIGNILLFVPLGIFIPLLFNKKNKIGYIVLYGAIVSIAIEIVQLHQTYNITDVDDIIFNTLGAALGYVVFNVIYKILNKTKYYKSVKSISVNYEGSLIIKAIKPIGTMMVAVLLLVTISIYNFTISDKLSNEEIAEIVFEYSDNSNFEVVKDIGDYKLFLKDDGEYLSILSLEKVLNTRWSNNRLYIGQVCKKYGDYSVAIMYDSECATVVVFGQNKEANKVKIDFLGNEYEETLNVDKYFMIVYPEFKVINEESDIYNYFNGEECKDLKVKFYDEDGNVYDEMKTV